MATDQATEQVETGDFDAGTTLADAGLALSASRTGAFGGLLPVVFALLFPPRSTLLRVEPTVLVGVDLVEALMIKPVTFLARQCS
jgi:hypothetical protein